jgi:hypothetical protein
MSYKTIFTIENKDWNIRVSVKRYSGAADHSKDYCVMAEPIVGQRYDDNQHFFATEAEAAKIALTIATGN